jgi:diguanylate cyclase (GGDEF)-like protein
MLRKAMRSKTMARAAVIGLSLSVIALAGLAGFSVSSNADTTEHIRTASLQSEQWIQVTLDVSIEYETLTDYLRASSDVGRQPLMSAVGSADDNLQWLAHSPDPADVEQASEASASYDAYTETLRELIAAENKGDTQSVMSLSEQAALGASTLRKNGIAQVARKRLELDHYLSLVDKRNQQLLFAGGIVVSVDLLMLMLCAFVVIGHQRRIERQARENKHRAGHDSLTGLANRSLLTERLDRAVSDAARSGKPGGLLLLDLDKFKEVNDSLGHHAGDLLLTEVAARLSGAVRGPDTVARLGGDEFAVLLPDAGNPDDCLDLARRILDAIQGPVELDGTRVDISASVGVAVFPAHTTDPAELLRHADHAMYTAKRSGRGAAVYDAEFSHTSEALRNSVQGSLGV